MSTEMQVCPQCGSPVAASALLCPKCGRPNVSTAFAGNYSTPLAESGSPSSLFSSPSEEQPPAEQPVEDETASSSSGVALETAALPKTPPTIPDALQPIMAPVAAPAGEAPAQFAQSELPASLQPGSVYAGPDSSPAALDYALSSLPPATQPIRVMTGSDTPIPVSLPPHSSPMPRASQARHAQYGPQDQPQTRGNGPTPQFYSVRPRQRVTDAAPQRDPRIAFVLELLAYLGFLGVGHIYGGQVKRGFGLMAAWWIALTVIVPALGSTACLVLAPLFVGAASGFWIWYEMGGYEQ